MRLLAKPHIAPTQHGAGTDATVWPTIAIANDSDYGLHGAVVTQNPASALYLARSVRTGTFNISAFPQHRGTIRWSQSLGHRTRHRPGGVEAYFELKTINLDTGTQQLLPWHACALG
ncbi:aldehyde dehydrogenase family protein [Rhodococcus koreensis]|uniref:aldehyde dehydrogenase family protein n=1 Tax=Rhodococcus koreensis TaxID=99653 RepID=UPI0036DF1623